MFCLKKQNFPKLHLWVLSKKVSYPPSKNQSIMLASLQHPPHILFVQLILTSAICLEKKKEH